MADTADGESVRVMPCRDVAGRERELTVRLDEHAQIVIHVPPGETAVLDPESVSHLMALLRETQTEALQQRGQW